jgi:ribosome-binding factor A
MTDRIKRVEALLQREIAEALYQVINEGRFDHAAVTVTRVEAARNLREARVWISIRGDDARRHELLGLIKHHRGDIQRLINRDLVMKFTPRLNFILDPSIEKGAHILDVLREVEAAFPSAPDPAPPADDEAAPNPGAT